LTLVLKFLNITSTLDIAQILNEMGSTLDFQSPRLCVGGDFFFVVEREGESLSHRLAVCSASNCFRGCEVHSEFGVEDES